MISTYSLVLALEAGVIVLAGFAIAAIAWRRPGSVLYSASITLLGLGLSATGLGTILLAFAKSELATALMTVAALAFVASGWNIAVDSVTPDDSFATEQLAEGQTRGFEEET